MTTVKDGEKLFRDSRVLGAKQQARVEILRRGGSDGGVVVERHHKSSAGGAVGD